MGRIFLKIAESGDNRCFEILFFGDEGSSDSIVFDIVPDELIGVEFRAVRRQEDHTQLLRNCFQEGLNSFGSMRRMAINDQEDFPAAAMNQALDELQKDPRGDRFFSHHEPKRPLGGNGRDHVESEPLACGSDNRGLSLDSPSGARMKIRPDPRLVLKEDLSPFPLGLGADSRIFLLEPLFDQGGILLQGFYQRFLAGEPQLGKQASDRGQRQADPIFFPKKGPDHASGPEGKWEFQLQWIFGGHGLIDPANLTGRELFGASRHLPRFEGIPSAGAIGGQPLVNATATVAQCLRNPLGAFPVLNLLNSTEANSFAGLVVDLAPVESVRGGWDIVHVPTYHKSMIM